MLAIAAKWFEHRRILLTRYLPCDRMDDTAQGHSLLALLVTRDWNLTVDKMCCKEPRSKRPVSFARLHRASMTDKIKQGYISRNEVT